MRLVAVIAFCSLFSQACVACQREAESPHGAEALGRSIEFSLAGIDGAAVTSSSVRGRVTVLLFLTTFDVASQAQARRLEDLLHRHTPRMNAIGVVVEAPRYVDLARAFRDSLGLSYPLAIASRSSLTSHPVFREVKSVPAWIFIDEEGRVRSAAAGALTPDQLSELVSGAASQ